MMTADFLHPIKVRCAVDNNVRTIDDISSMKAFLDAWPAERRGPVFNCAMNCCQGSMSGHISVEDARRSFVSFARITNILIDGGDDTVAAQGTMRTPHLPMAH
ncbi:DUF982 domain-containing protein [Limoniibacter endophyticus]|uniref:DUF982 domain-containing protein n=1 Tax=Limoniibacter endophyticus TaxID=1565040 RepID=A0A8J3DR33_9HYPH|nr:DUF982 domain-containing protein [Limoniibacter endophyticus]GHC68530.1 hypothetical protein GCM10010136_13330 [Limoniibacter endophyticus]